MKKLMLLGAASFMLFATSCNKSEDLNKAETPTITEVTYEMTTIAELKKEFGAANVVLDNGDINQMDADMPIYWISDTDGMTEATQEKSQCGNDLVPCASLTGVVNSQFQSIANECCCVFGAGFICCGQGGTTLAVLVLVTPRNPNCGIIPL